MTRGEAKEILITKAGLGGFVENIIDQIYNEHEVELKAKDDEIERLRAELSFEQNRENGWMEK